MSPICVLYVWQRDFGVNRILHCYSWIHARPNCMVYWTLLCMANVLVLHCYITICMQLQFLQWSLGIWLKKKVICNRVFLMVIIIRRKYWTLMIVIRELFFLCHFGGSLPFEKMNSTNSLVYVSISICIIHVHLLIWSMDGKKNYRGGSLILELRTIGKWERARIPESQFLK